MEHGPFGNGVRIVDGVVYIALLITQYVNLIINI